MEIAVAVAGGEDDELEQVAAALRERDEIAGAKIVPGTAEIEPGTLGAEEILRFIAENVALPMLVQALYDYLTRRHRTRSGADLRISLVRTDLPGGARRAEITLEGPASEVVEAIRKELA